MKWFLLFCILSFSSPAAQDGGTFCILDYGAVRDSTVLQTKAIQKAIDAAARRGGTVIIPEGKFLSGALHFRPGTQLRLDKDAVLRAGTPEALFDIRRLEGAGISGGTIEGEGLPGLFRIRDSRRVSVSSCRIRSGGNLIALSGTCSDIVVQDCDIKIGNGDLSAGGDVTWLRNKIRFTYNADEDKVGPYTLEDPLRFADGRPVRTPSEWQERRGEILSLFQREMYGRIPEPSPIYVDTLEESAALAGFGVRKRLRMWFREDRTGPKIDWMVLYPADAKGPVPAIITLNFFGNRTIGDGSGDLMRDWPLDVILARGFAFATACYGDVSPDPDEMELQDTLPWSGVFDLWTDSGTPEGPRAIGAWAWALMRGMDMLSADPRIDASGVVVTGSSRLGKAALLAGAFDERFAVVVANHTGGGGVPLAKRDFGEHVRSESARFRHWFSPSYAKYAGCEAAAMPFDQHLLVSCIAPRPLLVEGFGNPWFDTHGEFLCLQAASPVWEFLGAPGLPDVEWPDDYDTSAIGPRLGYVRRPHGHGYSAVDWLWLLDFAEGSLRRNAGN